MTGETMPSKETQPPAETEQQHIQDAPNTNVVETPQRSSTFKEQVYGYARLIHGEVLGQPDTKEQGKRVLRGEQGIPPRRGSQSSK